jgi:hypothetical protein
VGLTSDGDKCQLTSLLSHFHRFKANGCTFTSQTFRKNDRVPHLCTVSSVVYFTEGYNSDQVRCVFSLQLSTSLIEEPEG